MDIDRLNAKLNNVANAKIGKILGRPCRIYKPTGTGQAISVGNATAQMVNACFLPENLNPFTVKTTTIQGRFNATNVNVGDYLVPEGAMADDKTYFLADKQDALALLCVLCNTEIVIDRPMNAQTSYGGYNNRPVQGNSNYILGSHLDGAFLGWPCRLVMGGRAPGVHDRMPTTSPNQKGFAVYLPSSVPMAADGSELIKPGDRLEDKNGNRYVVSSLIRGPYIVLDTYQVHV
jgi:hypothetical protein